MRIASPWLLQTRPPSQTGAALRRPLLPATRITTRRDYPFSHRTPLRFINDHTAARARHHGDDGSSSDTLLEKTQTRKPRQAHQDEKSETSITSPLSSNDPGFIPHLSYQERKDPEIWVNLLEKYLPTNLQWRAVTQKNNLGDMHHECRTTEILAILNAARKVPNAGTNILAYMIVGRRRKAGLWFCDYLLKSIASRMPERSLEELPSNILWPRGSFYQITGKSINVDTVSYTSNQPCDTWNAPTPDPRYSFVMSNASDSTMDHIWTTLGSVVIQAADMVGGEGLQALNAVQLVLGQVHNLNLVPDNVYAYHISPYSSATRKTPIIHLVSSRILTALSDATWRDQQQENIEKAASHGLSYAEIGRDPPGGRFRLKVRPMDAEVWLEFILWCCAEGGFASAGARIVNELQENTNDPWFALTWTDNDGISQVTPRIDWARVKSRTGGTVGRLEGYSTVKPLAEMPARTISTEVVLALVEGHVDRLRRVYNGRGMTVDVAGYSIVRLLSFLEPHDLPVSYFDYIIARLLQSGAPEIDQSITMRKLFDRLTFLKGLRPARPPAPPRISFHFEALLVHSEFTAGLLQQAMDGFVQEGNIHDALKAFNDLQKLVDNSKLNAIGSFLQRIYIAGGDFFGSRFFEGNPDFVNSHGQLPMYKLASLLNLATDTDLIGFGQWLLYNDDPDGPLIPESSYIGSSMAKALLRFAGLSKDKHLLTSVSTQCASKRLPAVNYLRTVLNAQLSLLDLTGAVKSLKQLNRAQGGGFGLNNVAHLGGTILKLEQIAASSTLDDSGLRIHDATDLLDLMLAGRFSGREGVLQRAVRTTFKQQIAHLLALFRTFPDSSLSTLADAHGNSYRAGNTPNLPTTVFNNFLEAVISAKGVEEGVRLVDQFCNSKYDFGAMSTMTESDIEGEGDSWDIEADEASHKQPLIHSPWVKNDNAPIQAFIPFDQQSSLNQSNASDEFLVPEVETANTTTRDQNDLTSHEPPISHQFQSQFFDPQHTPQASSHPESTMPKQRPIVDSIAVSIYDARTIRLIVRKANRDLQNIKYHKPAQREVLLKILRWSQQKFFELGYDGKMIRNEIREPITNAIDPSSATLKLGRKSSKRDKANRASRITKSFGGRYMLSSSK